MKRAISLTILIIVVILGGQFVVNMLTKQHVFKYDISVNDTKYSIVENYIKKNGDTYDIEISDGTNSFYYAIDNNFNKQKKIITNIEVFKDGDNICIYPVLKNNIASYIECNSNGNLYSSYTYHNQGFINDIINQLKEKGYKFDSINDLQSTKAYSNVVMYENNIKDTDTILLWQYKGILFLNRDIQTSVMTLSFDKYENKLGALVGKYYVIPNYTNSNVLEFSSVTLIDLNTTKQKKIELNCILSSNTYINGIIGNKVYYTDPSNLIQIELNVKDKKANLLGNSEIGGKKYNNGNFEDANIYDFASSEIKFSNIPSISYAHNEIVEGGSSYYYYTNDGSIYQLIKGHLDKPILVYKASNLNNFRTVGEDIFYVVGNTLYSFNIKTGSRPLIVSNDLIYNTVNRINIYRNK